MRLCCRFAGRGADLVAKRVAEGFHGERLIVHLTKGKDVLCGRLKICVDGTLLPKIYVASAVDTIDPEDSSFGFCRLCYGSCFSRSKPELPTGGNDGAVLLSGDMASTGSSSSASESNSEGA